MSPPLPDLAAWDDAQRRAFALLGAWLGRLEPGMAERDVVAEVRALLADHGFDGLVSPPDVRAGPRTRTASPWSRPGRAVLAAGDLVTVALQPWSGTAMAAVAATACLGGEAPPLVDLARACTRATCGYATRWKCVGELLVFARSWAANHRLELVGRTIGHALLPPEGALVRGWPRSARVTTWLQRHQAHFLNPARVHGLWALAPRITDATRGAVFGEVIAVDGDDRRILGRDDPEAAGTLPG